MLVSTTIVKKYNVGFFEICETYKRIGERGKGIEPEMKYTIFYKDNMLLCDVFMGELGDLKELLDEVLYRG